MSALSPKRTLSRPVSEVRKKWSKLQVAYAWAWLWEPYSRMDHRGIKESKPTVLIGLFQFVH